MKRKTCFAAGLVCALAVSPCAVTAGTTTPEIERLAGLAKVWGAIKFFHPYLAERDIDWDSAMVQTIPKVESARTPAEYRQAIDFLLSSLHDPSTHTTGESASEPGSPASSRDSRTQPYVRWTDDRVAIVIATDAAQFQGNFDKGTVFGNIFAEAAKGKGIVVDFRSRRDHGDPEAGWWLRSAFMSAFPSVLSSDLVESSARSRMFSGYPSQSGTEFGGYYSGFIVQDGPTLRHRGAKNAEKPIAFLIDAGSPDLSTIFGGLEARGRAVVIRESAAGRTEGDADEGGFAMDLPDGVKVSIRTSEILNPDGTVGFHPTLEVPPSTAASKDDPAMEAALKTLREGIKPAGQHVATPAVTASRIENAYPDMTFPSREYRLLALFRFWNVIRYFHAYKQLLDRPWDETLTDFIPRFEACRTARDYAVTVAMMVARIQDSHGFVGSTILREYVGAGYAPLIVKSVEGQTVIAHVTDTHAAESAGVHPGDVILSVDGEEIGVRRERLGQLVAASTPQALRWKVDQDVLCGPVETPAKIRVRAADGQVKDVTLPRSAYRPKFTPETPVFQVLSTGFGYIDLTRLTPAQIDEAFEAIRNTNAVIFDMRGYPNGVFEALGARLTEKKVAAARFETPAPQSPDPDEETRVRFAQYAEPDIKWKYKGQVVVLIDENAISQSEHTCLFLEATAHAKFVGSPTNGANGDVTETVLPGNITVSFTGHDVRHADGRQLQRVGIQPDVRVEPTIGGIRKGRDEVLERAVAWLKANGTSLK